MQSNIPQSPVYDDYTEFDDTADNTAYYEEHSQYPEFYEEFSPENMTVESMDGTKRVLWLLLMVVFVIVVASIIMFWFVPYIETFTLGNPPPLPPAVQT
ncbi:MAG: hypothetical protein Phog2KO_42280 [Phototrophicaceae bacterium]